MLRRGWFLFSALAVIGCSDSNDNDAGTADTGVDVVSEAGMDSGGPMDATPDTAVPTDVTGDAGPDPWACLGHVAATTSPAATAMITLRAVNNSSHEPITGATIKVCAKTDLDCATPSAMGTSFARLRAKRSVSGPSRPDRMSAASRP